MQLNPIQWVYLRLGSFEAVKIPLLIKSKSFVQLV